MDLDEFFQPHNKEKLAGALDMTESELDIFMVNTFFQFLGQIKNGNCIGVLDYKGNKKGLLNIPVSQEKIKEFGRLESYDQRVEDYLGLVLDKENKRFGRICRIDFHDWKEMGFYHTTFADDFARKQYSDQDANFQKFLRSPNFCVNRSTYPVSYNDFLMAFKSIDGNFNQLKEDYQKLFREPLPLPETYLPDLK